jgi:ComF family protein
VRPLQHVARLLAPPVCILCGGDGQWLDEPFGLDLCIHCESACPRAPPGPGATFCLFRYEDPVDLLVQRLKFRRDIPMARVLGMLMARALRAADRPLPQCLVPLPLHVSRYRERGFCQTTEIARHIVRRLRRPDGSCLPLRRDLLHRVRATRAQSGLAAAERARNLEGAFAARRTDTAPDHVALLDDVLTTGRTAQAAVNALQAAGIRKVELWCCARALRHADDAPADPGTGPGATIWSTGPIC